MNDIILDEVDKIIAFIKDSDDYKNYIFLKEKLAKNKKANDLIQKIKVIQKKLVKLELNKSDTSILEKEMNLYLEELNKIPLYVEYIQKQEYLNEVYQTIKTRLDDYFYEKLN